MKNYRYKSSSKKRINKKYILPIALISIVVALCSYSTFAWIASGADTFVNNFKLQGSSIELHEDFENGDPVKKNVFVENTGDSPMYVRILLVEQITKDDGATVVPNTTGGLYFTYEDLMGDDWFLGDDGYYYYSKPLESQGKTSMLFTSATKKETVILADGEKLTLTVMTEAIQVNGVKDAWDITPNEDGTIGGTN